MWLVSYNRNHCYMYANSNVVGIDELAKMVTKRWRAEAKQSLQIEVEI